MNALLEHLLKAIESNNWTAFFVVVAIALLLNLRTISEFFAGASRHQRFVETSLKIEPLSETSRQFLEEELNYYIFKRLTGISADAALRERLRDVIARSKGELQIRQLARVRPFIRVKDGHLVIVVTKLESAWSYVNLFLAALVSLISLALFMAPGLVKPLSLPQSLISVGFGIFFFAFAMFIYWEAMPAVVAKQIATIVERIEGSSTDDD